MLPTVQVRDAGLLESALARPAASVFGAAGLSIWAVQMMWIPITAAGMTLDNLVKATVFLAERADGVANREVRRAVLGDRRIAMTVVVAGIFDERWLVEIEAVAAAGGPGPG